MKYCLGLLTKPCTKHNTRLATLDELRKRLSGISGYRARLFWLKIKSIDMKQPNTMRQMILGEFQGNITPPKSKPRSSISVKPKIEKLPHQSMALMPSRTFVFGL